MTNEFKPGDRVPTEECGAVGPEIPDSYRVRARCTLHAGHLGTRHVDECDQITWDSAVLKARPWERVTEDVAHRVTEFPESTRLEPTGCDSHTRGSYDSY